MVAKAQSIQAMLSTYARWTEADVATIKRAMELAGPGIYHCPSNTRETRNCH